MARTDTDAEQIRWRGEMAVQMERTLGHIRVTVAHLTGALAAGSEVTEWDLSAALSRVDLLREWVTRHEIFQQIRAEVTEGLPGAVVVFWSVERNQL